MTIPSNINELLSSGIGKTSPKPPDSGVKIALVLSSLFYMNAFDAFVTSLMIQVGVAKELNPVMGFLIDISPLAFILAKMAMISIVCIMLWNRRIHKDIRVTAYIALGAYSLLAVYQCLLVYVIFFKEW